MQGSKVCKVKDCSGIDLSSPFCFIGITDEENSLVCPEEPSLRHDRGFAHTDRNQYRGKSPQRPDRRHVDRHLPLYTDRHCGLRDSDPSGRSADRAVLFIKDWPRSGVCRRDVSQTAGIPDAFSACRSPISVLSFYHPPRPHHRAC